MSMVSFFKAYIGLVDFYDILILVGLFHQFFFLLNLILKLNFAHLSSLYMLMLSESAIMMQKVLYLNLIDIC